MFTTTPKPSPLTLKVRSAGTFDISEYILDPLGLSASLFDTQRFIDFSPALTYVRRGKNRDDASKNVKYVIPDNGR